MTAEITTRPLAKSDINQLCKLLNEIIEIGGTTAYTERVTSEGMIEKFFNSKSTISCFVALDAKGQLAGFQSMVRTANLPADCADIATFARVAPKVRGVGTMLLEQSKKYASEIGCTMINATIRADNEGGLVFYDKMGFETYNVVENTELADGTVVDRIQKKLSL